MLPLSAAEFAALMAPLGPFGPACHVAVGVSGGPHSLALALLAAEWTRSCGGTVLALVVDHGLRAEAAAEAASVSGLLAGQGIAVRVIRLGLPAGPALQERARAARLVALQAACTEAGAPWLLLGHHRADQAETLLLRARSGSGARGLAGMARLRAERAVLILRPLLGVAPARLEAVVAAAGLDPVRDPSNADPRFARAGLRAGLADPDGTGAATAALAEAAGAFGARRARQEAALAARLAGSARLLPTGHAEIDPAALGADPLADAALAVLVRVVGGRSFAPPLAAAAALRARGQGTLAGTWLRSRRNSWLLLREPGCLAPAVPARPGARWDGRFRLLGAGRPGCTLGALGPRDAATVRRHAPHLPAALLAGLPALRQHDMLAAVPPLGYPDLESCEAFPLVLAPEGGPVTGGADWRGRADH